jgi:hypothetical protein
MAQPQLRLRRGRGPSAGVIVRRVILIPRTSHRRHDRRRTMRTEHLPASRVEVRCAGPVAGHLRIASSHRDHLPPCPALRSGGWNRAAPGSCWRRVPMLAARELPANDPLAVPTPPPPVTCGLTRGVCRHEIVLVCVEINRWTWWPEHTAGTGATASTGCSPG